MAELLYTFYGDDFTGSTDVLEQLAAGGVRAALFLKAPTPADLDQLPGLQAFGLAGDSRSQTPAWMASHLPAVFTGLRAFGAPVTHYKVCSTFDSSPTRGSIGRALEIGRDVFHSAVVPILVGAPHLRRYVLDGRLFAADPTGMVHRIDRHPMRLHPVTPMRQPRLREHLAAQTALRVCEAREVSRAETLFAGWQSAEENGCEAILFDTVHRGDLLRLGHLLWSKAKRQPLFGVGSSGFTAALIAEWHAAGLLSRAGTLRDAAARQSEPEPRLLQPAPILVASGSCSAATERQLRWALAHGFVGVPLDPAELLNGRDGEEVAARAITTIEHALHEGSSAVVYTSIGTPAGMAHGELLGAALGHLLRSALERTGIRRAMLCGGDTSSHAVQQLGIRALTWKANLQPGAPLCEAHGDGPLNGLEIVLKGGQVGTDDFFAVVRDA